MTIKRELRVSQGMSYQKVLDAFLLQDDLFSSAYIALLQEIHSRGIDIKDPRLQLVITVAVRENEKEEKDWENRVEDLVYDNRK